MIDEEEEDEWNRINEEPQFGDIRESDEGEDELRDVTVQLYTDDEFLNDEGDEYTGKTDVKVKTHSSENALPVLDYKQILHKINTSTSLIQVEDLKSEKGW